MTPGLAAFVCAVALGFGAVVGSYAGVVRARGWRGSLQGRSRCESCRRELRWYELMPLVSYALQGGRCRRCGGEIGSTALLFETAGAAVALAVALAVVLTR
ncbi:MAG: prepilin peptidase [Candidatus Dormibacteria bacterium]